MSTTSSTTQSLLRRLPLIAAALLISATAAQADTLSDIKAHGKLTVRTRTGYFPVVRVGKESVTPAKR